MDDDVCIDHLAHSWDNIDTIYPCYSLQNIMNLLSLMELTILYKLLKVNNTRLGRKERISKFRETF